MGKEIELRRIALESQMLSQLEKAVANTGALQDPFFRIQKLALKKLQDDLEDDRLSGFRASAAARALTENLVRMNRQILDMYNTTQGMSGLTEDPDEEITDVEAEATYATIDEERAAEKLLLALINSSLADDENDQAADEVINPPKE